MDDVNKYAGLFGMHEMECAAKIIIDKFNKYNLEKNTNRQPFSIILEPDTNGNAWWFPIHSISLELIREELGLSRKRAIDLHYCPGYENPGKVKELQLK